MKRNLVAALGLAAMLAGLCGCAEKKPVLHIYTWSDYIKPELVAQFEQENNCKVVIDTYDSNESMYAKLKAGATGYDLLFPSSYMVKIMNDQGMLQKLNLDLVPNRKNVDPDYMKLAIDSAMDHSVPYTVTITCLGYLGSKVPDFKPTWAMLDREDLKGRMTMLNDCRETIGAALKFLGYSLNTLDDQELAQANVRLEAMSRTDGLLQIANRAYFEERLVQACAQALGIHRNTLRYRLERIAELSGLDLNRLDQRLQLSLGLGLLESDMPLG